MALRFRIAPRTSPLCDLLLEQSWEEAEDAGESFNLWWKSSRFRDIDVEGVKAHQRLNHFPRSTPITKKDCLARTLRKMRCIFGSLYAFAPASFLLPGDHDKFVAEATANPSATWICKPADAAQGKGIFLFRGLDKLEYDQASVVQQYIERPLTIGGYKLDIRLYVCVTSFHPLTIYMFRDGLVRFGTQKYDMADIDNPFSHLTNTSINKYSPTLDADKDGVGAGCKWTIGQLRDYFQRNSINDERLWNRIAAVVILTLISFAPDVPRTRNCFELYGFDILIDEKLKPWLLEVNLSPSLNLDTPVDHHVKKPMLRDIMLLLGLHAPDDIRPQPGAPAADPDPSSSASSSSAASAHSKSATARSRPSSATKASRVAGRPSAANTSVSSGVGLDAQFPPTVGGYTRLFPFDAATAKCCVGRRVDFKAAMAAIRGQLAFYKDQEAPAAAAAADGSTPAASPSRPASATRPASAGRRKKRPTEPLPPRLLNFAPQCDPHVPHVEIQKRERRKKKKGSAQPQVEPGDNETAIESEGEVLAED